MDAIQIEHGDNIHFYRLKNDCLWMWERKNNNSKNLNDIELIFTIKTDGLFIDSKPYHVKLFNSFSLYVHNIAEAKAAIEYQLNTVLPDEPFETYEAIILTIYIRGKNE